MSLNSNKRQKTNGEVARNAYHVRARQMAETDVNSSGDDLAGAIRQQQSPKSPSSRLQRITSSTDAVSHELNTVPLVQSRSRTDISSGRTNLACIACRAKKQKCSGDKPICSQCLSVHRVCDWPQQQKRGPTKGYLEALEQRLRRTEELLHNSLSLLPVDQFQRVTRPGRDQRNRLIVPNEDGTGLQEHSEKAGMDYWREFPLDTTDDLSQWFQVYQAAVSGSDLNVTPKDSTFQENQATSYGPAVMSNCRTGFNVTSRGEIYKSTSLPVATHSAEPAYQETSSQSNEGVRSSSAKDIESGMPTATMPKQKTLDPSRLNDDHNDDDIFW